MKNQPQNLELKNEGWKYVTEDGAFHYFRNGISLCSYFTLKKSLFTPRKHDPENSCAKCLCSSSNLKIDQTAKSDGPSAPQTEPSSPSQPKTGTA
jgi:hypothetical protein